MGRLDSEPGVGATGGPVWVGTAGARRCHRKETAGGFCSGWEGHEACHCPSHCQAVSGAEGGQVGLPDPQGGG